MQFKSDGDCKVEQSPWMELGTHVDDLLRRCAGPDCKHASCGQSSQRPLTRPTLLCWALNVFRNAVLRTILYLQIRIFTRLLSRPSFFYRPLRLKRGQFATYKVSMMSVGDTSRPSSGVLVCAHERSYRCQISSTIPAKCLLLTCDYVPV